MWGGVSGTRNFILQRKQERQRKEEEKQQRHRTETSLAASFFLKSRKKIDIELNKPFYLTVFQVLPYEKKDYQVYKLFPNDLEPNNYLKDNSFKLPQNAKYQIEFPNVSNK